MKPTIEDVIDLLQQVRQNEPADNHNIWKQRFEWLAEELERHKADARDLLEEYTEQGLKLGTIEAVRAAPIEEA